jgi:hypothetical protein
VGLFVRQLASTVASEARRPPSGRRECPFAPARPDRRMCSHCLGRAFRSASYWRPDPARNCGFHPPRLSEHPVPAPLLGAPGLLRFARNDGVRAAETSAAVIFGRSAVNAAIDMRTK